MSLKKLASHDTASRHCRNPIEAESETKTAVPMTCPYHKADMVKTAVGTPYRYSLKQPACLPTARSGDGQRWLYYGGMTVALAGEAKNGGRPSSRCSQDSQTAMLSTKKGNCHMPVGMEKRLGFNFPLEHAVGRTWTVLLQIRRQAGVDIHLAR